MTTALLIPILATPRTLQTCDRCGATQKPMPCCNSGPARWRASTMVPAMYLDPINITVICARCLWGNPENN